MRRDEAHLQVVEAMLVTLVLLAAAYAVMTLRVPANETDRTRDKLEKVATDSMLVLAGIDEERGNLLDLGLQEAIHCVAKSVAPMCTGARSSNLSLRIESYLPEGTGYALLLSNGAGERELYRSSAPPGEAVSASYSFLPDWNATFVVTELSCYEAAMDVNATLVAIRHGNVTTPSRVILNDTTTHGNWGNVSYANPGWWNVTLPAAERAASSYLKANITAKRGTLPGNTTYGSCDLGGLGPTIRDAFRASTLKPGFATVPVGTSVAFQLDLAPVAAVAGLTMGNANLTILEAMAPRDGIPDEYAPTAFLPLGAGPLPSATWNAPASATYGAHPVLVRVGLTVDVGGTPVQVEGRLVGQVNVALPSGTVPLEPPYRAIIQAWFPDWR